MLWKCASTNKMLPTSEERQKGTSGVYTLKLEMAAKSSKRFQSAVSFKLEKVTKRCKHFQSAVSLKPGKQTAAVISSL